MPELEPFRGVRYSARVGTDLTPVTAPPYDVIDDEERAALAARHPENSVQLILPEGDDTTRYEHAAATLAGWQAEGVLETDSRPKLYAYRMDHTDESGRHHHTLGVLGALRLPADAGDGSVLPHERTSPRAKSDRLALLRATRANLDPIWLLSGARGLSELVTEPGSPEATAHEGGVEHRLWSIDDPARISAIGAAVAGAPLVLADGHHRFETALTYRDDRGPTDDAAGAILALVVELTEEQLVVRAIHRLFSGLPPGFDLRAVLASGFEIHDGGGPGRSAQLIGRVDAGDGLGLVDRRGGALLVPRTETTAAARTAHGGLSPLDATIVETAVLPTLADSVTVTYRHDAAAVAALVATGAVDAALLLRPATVGQIDEAATAGLRMPQKTTFFAPKPRTGMVFRLLDT